MDTVGKQVLFFSLIALCGASLPLAIRKGKTLPFWLLPMATGMMVGLCLFGLLPEVMREGGRLTLGVLTLVAVIYSLVHFLHVIHHAHLARGHQACTRNEHDADCQVDHEQHSLIIFLSSIMIHSLLDGALLVVSNNLKATAYVTILVSLGIHKFFEAVSVSSMIIGRLSSGRKALSLIALYLLSFPSGVLAANLSKQLVSSELLALLAVVVMAAAIGNLLSCLVYDFVLPVIKRFREAKTELAWMLCGFATAGMLLLKIF